ncbi:hypothetical protein Lser_V15G08427 [Lactuca serriola]
MPCIILLGAAVMTVDLDFPNTTESYRLYCQRFIASDIKECVCRAPDTPYDEIGSDRFKTPDVLFNPSLIKTIPGMEGSIDIASFARGLPQMGIGGPGLGAGELDNSASYCVKAMKTTQKGKNLNKLKQMLSLFDVAMRSGSSRDWAAKGPMLHGVKAVIAKSFERIHRSDFVGMGIIPLCFKEMEDQVFDIPSLWADVFSGCGQEHQADSSKDLSSKISLAHFSSVMPFLLLRESNESGSALKIGVVLSGGQAPGGHNVIYPGFLRVDESE